MELQGHFENGFIVPHNGVTLPNGTQVTIIVQEPKQRAEKMTDEERQRYLEALARIDAVPDENPDDTFSGADHDRVLYGDQS